MTCPSWPYFFPRSCSMRSRSQSDVLGAPCLRNLGNARTTNAPTRCRTTAIHTNSTSSRKTSRSEFPRSSPNWAGALLLQQRIAGIYVQKERFAHARDQHGHSKDTGSSKRDFDKIRCGKSQMLRGNDPDPIRCLVVATMPRVAIGEKIRS